MTTIDWSAIAVYLVALIALSLFLGRGQKGEEDQLRNHRWHE
jgi:hypothetical protein